MDYTELNTVLDQIDASINTQIDLVALQLNEVKTQVQNLETLINNIKTLHIDSL